MSDVTDPEVLSTFGSIDSLGIADQFPASAHALRSTAVQINQLYDEGEPLLQLIFPSIEPEKVGGESADAKKKAAGYASGPGWQPLYWGPLIAPKQAQHALCEVQLIARVAQISGDNPSIYVQVGTLADPFDPNVNLHTLPNKVIEIAATASTGWQEFSATGIALRRGALFEQFTFHVASQLSETLVSTATYGGWNSGTARTVSGVTNAISSAGNEFADTAGGGGTWNDDPTTETTLDDGSVYVTFETTANTGQYLTTPRKITGVVTDRILRFDPPLSPTEVALCEGSRYELKHLPEWHLANVAVYSTDLGL